MANSYKVNSDAAINEKEGVAGIGVIIRNSDRAFVAASTNRTNFFGDIEFV